MKQALLILICSLLTINAFARPDKEVIDCSYSDSDAAWANARVFLNSTGYTSESERSQAISASLIYNYSSASDMTCFGEVKGSEIHLNCIGYYAGGETTELKVRTQGETITAYWRTNKIYGSIDIKSTCTVKERTYDLPGGL